LIFEPNSFRIYSYPVESLIPLLKLAVFASSLAFLFYTYSVQKLGAVKANIFTNLIPVLTAFFSFVFFKENLLLHNIIGIFIVISGLILSQINPVQMVKNVRNKRNSSN
jgi:drug/metabolite transporter (DMT)-like permease